MAKDKKSFLLYADMLGLVSKLPDHKAGKLFKLILEYVNDKNPQTDDLLLQVAFEPIKLQLKRDLAQWESERQKRSEAGKSGGLKSGEARRSKRKQKEAKGSSASKIEANEADNVTVTVNVTDSVIQEQPPVFNPELLVPQMHQLFKEQNPNGFFDPKEDFAPLREIAEKIKRWLNLEGEFLQHARPILDNWRYILTHVKADKHLAKYSLSQVNKYFSSIVQSYNQSGKVPVKQETVKKDYSTTKKILEEVYGKVED